MTASPDRIARKMLRHPTEIGDARRYYLAASSLRVLSSPPVFVAMMLVLLSVSNNSFTPVIGPFLGMAFTAYVERRFRADAWAHIPRGHQDAGRDEPTMWAVIAAFTEIGVLLFATITFLTAASTRALATAPSSLGSGALLGLMFVTATTLLWDSRAPRDRRISYASSTVAIMFGTGALMTSACTVLLMFDRVDFDLGQAMSGVVIVVFSTALCLLMRLVPHRVRCSPAAWIDPGNSL